MPTPDDGHSTPPKRRRLQLITAAVLALAALAMSMIGYAATASNTVPATNLSASNHDPGVNDLKPSECDAVTYAARLVGLGNVTGTNADQVILGGPAVQTLRGQGGADCVVGGGGNDSVQGGNGNDILLGGPGNDAMVGNAGTDICIGGAGLDTFTSCETQVQ